jgi:hypothetical protein
VRIRTHDEVRVVAAEQVRLEHFAGSVPWRWWRSYHGQPHLSGSYWAATVADHVVYESRLELERLLLADFDPRVAAMWAQPCLLSQVVDGVERRNVPDFLFACGDGAVTVVNVKPAARLLEPSARLRVRHNATKAIETSSQEMGSAGQCVAGAGVVPVRR